jgi:hypothetical protein
MRRQERRLGYIAFIIVASAFGLAISASLLGNPAPFHLEFARRKTLVSVVFGSVCVAGILAALFPLPCEGVLGIRSRPGEDAASLGMRATRLAGVLVLHGHHPPGPGEKRHELRFGRKSFCASCYGLLTGAVVSLAMVAVFALTSWRDIHLAYVLYGLGVLAAILALVQALVFSPGARTRFVLAAGFVVGASLMLIATDMVTTSLAADLFIVLLAVFWLLSRISLSHRD